MSDTPAQPPLPAAAPTVEVEALPPAPPVKAEKAPETKIEPKAAEAGAVLETFDNPQFRPGEFTPYVSPATERPHETTASTPPPIESQPPTEELKAAAPVIETPVRPIELTANAPTPSPSALPARTTELTANAPAPVPPAPAPALPVARLPSPPPAAKGAPIAAFAGFAIGGYVLGVISAVLVLGSRPIPEPLSPPPPPPTPAPQVAAAPSPKAAPPVTEPAVADDVRVPEPASAPATHREHEHEHEGSSTEHHHSATASAPTPSPAPPPNQSASGAIKLYETATLAEALQAAKHANNAILVARLTQLIGARQRAEEARRDKDAAKEAASVDEAYRVDYSIDRGAGPYHHPLLEEAVRLHLQLGDQALARRDTLQASIQFRQALAIQPDSAEAKKKLAGMGQKP